MVDLMDFLIKIGSVQKSVGEIMPGVFKYEEYGDLVKHFKNRGKGDGRREPTVLRHRVEEPTDISSIPCHHRSCNIPDLRKFDSEVGKQYKLRAFPLFLRGRHLLILDLVFIKEAESINDDPGKRAAEVNDLVHYKRHDPGGEDIVLHISVPCCPHALKNIKVHVVLGDLVELGPISVWARCKERTGHVPASLGSVVGGPVPSEQNVHDRGKLVNEILRC